LKPVILTGLVILVLITS